MKTTKTSKGLSYFILFGIFILINLAFQNCAKTDFNIDPVAKSEALGKENVFGNREAGDDGNQTRQEYGDDDSIDDNDDDDNNSSDICSEAAPSQPMKIPLSFECSDSHSEKFGGNLMTLAAVKLVVVSKADSTVACEIQGDFKTEILNTKTLSFTPCAGPTTGEYIAYLVDKNITGPLTKDQSLTKNEIRFTVQASGASCIKTKKVDLLFDFNQQTSEDSSTDAQNKCDSRKSPLVVSLNSEARGIELTAPLDGIQFDILGQRSYPYAHAKKQISWLTSNSKDYYFVTLPKKGQVLGIDEMFGDNTRGPDGQYAENGYLALAKYDEDHDGLITAEDSVFTQLRLWNDLNRDGQSQLEELFTMKDKALTVIDLNYDKNYEEEDAYGNQTLMKSVVKSENGQLHLIFDLWFRYLNITK